MKFILSWSNFLEKHLWLYFFLQFTWGLLSNILGFFIFLFFLCLGKKPKLYHHFIYQEYSLFGNSHWGGFSMGCFFFCSPGFYEGGKAHEAGHSYQVALYGPLFFLIIGIPSVIRYWVFTIRENHGKVNPPYDSMWFENQATTIGKELFIK